jgi:hypothetical protein
MNGRERIETVLKGQWPDQRPVLYKLMRGWCGNKTRI